MFRVLLALFSSPESLLQVLSQSDIAESIEEGERIIIDEDGNSMVNIASLEVRAEFSRHVDALKRV